MFSHHRESRGGSSKIPARPRARRRCARPRCEALEDRTLLTIKFAFNYSLDANGFFNDPARRGLLEVAGRMLGDKLDDTLSAIAPSGSNTWTGTVSNPATGASKTYTNLSVKKNEIIIFAGGRDLPNGQLGFGQTAGYGWRGSTAWGDVVATRGQAGVKAGTDRAPWGGSITFDSKLPAGRGWNFGVTTAGLTSARSDFLSVAIHELGHILGIGKGSKPWERWIKNGRFTGPKAVAANNNRSIPIDPGGAHWAEGTRSDDGVEAAMDPTITGGARKFFSKLDFAALRDIGWQVNTDNGTIYLANHTLSLIPTPGLGEETNVVFSNSIGDTGASSSRDVDIYRVYAGAGTTLGAAARRTTTGKRVDTYLRLFDASGKQLAAANQGGVGGTDNLTFRVGRSDYYYVAVSSSANRGYNPLVLNSGPGGPTGDYSLGISIGT